MGFGVGKNTARCVSEPTQCVMLMGTQAFVVPSEETAGVEATTKNSDLYIVLEYKQPGAYTRAYALLTIRSWGGRTPAMEKRRCSADVAMNGGVRALGKFRVTDRICKC